MSDAVDADRMCRGCRPDVLGRDVGLCAVITFETLTHPVVIDGTEIPLSPASERQRVLSVRIEIASRRTTTCRRELVPTTEPEGPTATNDPIGPPTAPPNDPPTDSPAPPSSEPHRGRHDRTASIIEALLLAAVALLAAWSGYSSARWSTDSRLDLAKASGARTEASRANLDAGETRNLDASTFNAWFSAYIADDQRAMALAERRFRPEFDVAFRAWMATDPTNNLDAPPGPASMPEYVQPDVERSKQLEATADRLSSKGMEGAGNADDYVRITVYLASVLFLVGISGHFRIKAARIGLVVVACTILTYSVILLAAAPKPPG